jgi:NOL1/NOP2/fmu family ribosome biogenesis protein
MEPLPLNIEDSWGFQSMSESGHAYQAYQHRVKGEGFYMAVYRKVGDEDEGRSFKGRGEWSEWKGELPWTSIKEGYEAVEWKGKLYAADERVMALLDDMDQRRMLKRPGLPLGEWKGKDFIPHVGTALAPGWADAEQVELSLDEAWAYLRRESPQIKGPERAWTVMTYKGHSLGWAKWVNGRMKNHYPKEWRTRTSW